MNSTEIRCALRLRYPAGSHALLWEVANSTGSAQRRFADAVAIGLWPSHGHEIEGIEIKISRGDWLRECAQPEKSQEVFQFCHRWWLAAPKGLVSADELPVTWGLLELVGDVLRVKKKAPALKPRAPALGFVASMLRRHAGADAEMTEELLRRERKADQEQLEKQRKLQRDSDLSFRQRQLAELDAKLIAIREATGIDFNKDFRPAADWIAAIKFLSGRAYGDGLSRAALDELRAQLASVIKKIDAFPILPRDIVDEAAAA